MYVILSYKTITINTLGVNEPENGISTVEILLQKVNSLGQTN